MWASALSAVKRGVDAGTCAAPLQLGHISAGSGLRPFRPAARPGAISPRPATTIGYYCDNDPRACARRRARAELDKKHGIRQRPIYILQGNWGRAVAYNAYGDLVGTYQRPGQMPQVPLLTLQQISGQTSPVVFGQIQQGNKTSAVMQGQVLSVLTTGARAIGYWHTRPIVQEAWYPSFPGIVAAALHYLNTTCAPLPAPCYGH
jgi:hypothetical protein